MGIRITLRRDILKRLRVQSIQTGFLTYFLLVVVAYYLMPPTLISDLLSFFGGDIKGVIPGGDMVTIMGALVAIVVLRIPITVTIGWIMKKILGKPTSRASFFKYGEDKKYWLAYLLYTVAFEEIFARQLFLDVLPKLLHVESTWGLWGLLILGNVLWAYLHLYNFSKERDRKFGYVLTQFIGGFFYAFVFLKFGLIPSILMHFMFNAVLFSGLKGQISENYRLQTTFTQLCIAGISYMLFNQNVGDLLLWIQAEGKPIPLPGWGLLDYITISLTISCTVQAIFTLLRYDEIPEDKKELILERVLGIGVGAILFIGMVLCADALLSEISSIYLRTVGAFLIIMSILRSGSPNYAVKIFWGALTSGWLSICCILALGWQMGAIYVIVLLVSSWIANYFYEKFAPKPATPSPVDQNKPWSEIVKEFYVEK